MALNKTQRIERILRTESKILLESSFPEAVYSTVIIEDISVSGEKWCLNQLIPKYTAEVADKKAYDMDYALDQKVLDNLHARMAKLETFK